MLVIVLKVAERCNIRCTYCYYFEGENKSYSQKPKFLTPIALVNLHDFLKREFKNNQFNSVLIVFHGGEPLLIGTSKMAEICNQLGELDKFFPVYFGITTNGMLVDELWIEVFVKYKISVTVSLDGDQKVHDTHRLDFKGRGTYDRTIVGIKKLLAAAKDGRLSIPTVLCVVGSHGNGFDTYRHLTHNLEFTSIDLRLPLFEHDTIPAEMVGTITNFMLSAFQAWAADRSPRPKVAIFDRLLKLIVYRNSLTRFDTSVDDLSVVSIASDGQINVDDNLISFSPLWSSAYINIAYGSLDELKNSLCHDARVQLRQVPTPCKSCDWLDVCNPHKISYGDGMHRYSREHRFDNSLVFCKVYKTLFKEMESFVISQNIVPDQTDAQVSDKVEEYESAGARLT